MEMLATHEHVDDFGKHIWNRHDYSGSLPIDNLKLAEFHAHLHAAGMGHKFVEPTVADGTRGMERGR